MKPKAKRKPRQTLPGHLKARYGTIRRFRHEKRQQLAEVQAALDHRYLGCAYMPLGAHMAIDRVRREMSMIRTAANTCNWGR